MRARIGAGIAGWLAGLLPLVGVNIASYAGAFGYEPPVLAGLAALCGGILFGGIVAGGLGARRSGGAPGAGMAGLVAAFLYAASVIGLLFSMMQWDSTSLPLLVAEHPLRASVAVVFCALLLLAVALLVGMLKGRGVASVEPQPASHGGPPQARAPSPPSHPRDPQGAYRQPLPREGVRPGRLSAAYDGSASRHVRGDDRLYASSRQGTASDRGSSPRRSGPRWPE